MSAFWDPDFKATIVSLNKLVHQKVLYFSDWKCSNERMSPIQPAFDARKLLMSLEVAVQTLFSLLPLK
jgi:hypothetical protein